MFELRHKRWVIVTQKYVIELVFPLVVKVRTKTWVIVTIVKENVLDKQTNTQTNSYFINIDELVRDRKWLNASLTFTTPF